MHLSAPATAQAFWNGSHLKTGEYQVGFKNYVKEDKTRTYARLYDWNNTVLPRPVSISIWYPAGKIRKNDKLAVKDYLRIVKQEEEWEALPDERILSWFYNDTEQNRAKLEWETKAHRHAEPAKGKFPVVIYAPSYQASSIENFVLCEFLASHGYVVISSPSRGTDNRFLSGGTTKDIETQARDIEFLMGEASSLSFIDTEQIALIGFSFGGISNVLVQMRNENVKALIGLDGSVKYQLPKLLASPTANLSHVDVPFLFMSQKDIPLQVMIEDKIDTSLNVRFEFYDSLKYSEAYYLKFNDLTHAYFSSLGVLFQERDPRQDKNNEEIIRSYCLVNDYTLHFLNAFLKGADSSKQFLDSHPGGHGAYGNLIETRSKKPMSKKISFEHFNLLAQKQGYTELELLFRNLNARNPRFALQEWKLNNLGLQLLFQGKIREGINVLTLATVLYPNSANAFDSLGEGYLIQGNDALAIKSFKTSLQLDPGNSNASMRLKALVEK